MELDPQELSIFARRWTALGDDLAAAAVRARNGPAADAPEQALLVALADALAGLARDVDRMVDGLLLTAREVVEADRRVADAFARGADPVTR